MKIVEVIPISRGVANPTLSYFTAKNVAVGDFLKVPIRKKLVSGVVAAVHNASEEKTSLKRSPYPLRPISSRAEDKSAACLPDNLLSASTRTAEFYATTLGAVLGAVIPKIFFENPALVWGKRGRASRSPEARPQDSAPKSETLVLQLESEERFGQYKALIRESLAKKSSVMFVAPSELEAQRAYKLLSHGIEDYAHLFTLSRKPKELKSVISKVRGTDHSILLVTTPAGAALDRPDLKTVIMERESSRAYRTFSRPYMHLRVFLEHYCLASKKRLVLGDSVLSMESLWKERNGEYREIFPISWRLETRADTRLIDMKSAGKDDFRVISPELEELIGRALEERSGIFLFGARKGLAPTTICDDCGSILSCLNCGAPVVLYDKPPQIQRENSGHASRREHPRNFREEFGAAARVYICHACKAERPAKTVCDTCRSWRLSALGIGIDRIREEARKLFPRAQISVLDKNHAPTDAKARKVTEDFSARGGILIGTELALLHVERAAYAGLVSADALFSIPDFGIHERIFHLVSKLREMAEKKVIIQTRNIGKQVLAWAAAGNILDFYREEIAEREEFSYPPFSMFIKISGKGVPLVKDTFADWDPHIVDGSLVIRLPRDSWPDKELASALALLTPDFLIKVDPESIL